MPGGAGLWPHPLPLPGRGEGNPAPAVGFSRHYYRLNSGKMGCRPEASYILLSSPCHCRFRCTSCLSARWKCHWCPSTYSCVSNHSQCEDVLRMEVRLLKLLPASPSSAWHSLAMACARLGLGLPPQLLVRRGCVGEL